MAKPLFIGAEAIGVSRIRAHDGTETPSEPYGSEEGRRAGEEVWEMIREALGERPEDRRVRALGECVRRFPDETLRHPDVCDYLDHLARRGNTEAITRILADRPRRGRPARTAGEEFTETAIMHGIMHREGCSARRAAEIAKRDHRYVFGHKYERTIENDYARTREAYRVWIQHRWLPGSNLTDEAWTRNQAEGGDRADEGSIRPKGSR
jgi:hypothetical protein